MPGLAREFWKQLVNRKEVDDETFKRSKSAICEADNEDAIGGDPGDGCCP